MNPKKGGRPKNMVFDSSIGRGMTLNQYAKHMKEQSISKTEVVKRGILTKAQLEKAIAEGHIKAVQIGATQYVSKTSIQNYLNS
jgi:hypothetical protein